MYQSACDPGPAFEEVLTCKQIFTRAEHRKYVVQKLSEDLLGADCHFRRHEANHNTQPAFQCTIEGCRKPFQRADLLTRHMERQ